MAQGAFKDKEKPTAVRSGNISAARAVADAVRTSLGPRGMDKMIQTGKGETIITNDGATALRQMGLQHPAAKMLVDLSHAQDIEAGDGTTSVVVIAGSLLGAAERLLRKGIHPTIISESFQRAAAQAVTILDGMSVPLTLPTDLHYSRLHLLPSAPKSSLRSRNSPRWPSMPSFAPSILQMQQMPIFGTSEF